MLFYYSTAHTKRVSSMPHTVPASVIRITRRNPAHPLRSAPFLKKRMRAKEYVSWLTVK